MVKNILILRFGNSFFGATWNRQNIDNVQITFKEPFGTEGRGGYFDEFGIIRDVMQNHLLQVLTLLAMERPISFSAEDIRDEKVRVLRAIPAIEPKNVIIGQYGKSLDGSKPSYKEDDTVPKDSRCPTFCALVAYIKNERWDGVPFIMKAGKALNEQKTEIRIQFKDVTSGIFKDIPRNELVMRIQPNESVYVKMNSKLPGLSMQTVVTELDLTYRRRFSDLKIPEAYESLILDCLKGDHSNFVRDDELDASWRIFTPLLHYLDDNKEIIPMEYPYGEYTCRRNSACHQLTPLSQALAARPCSTTSPLRTDTSSATLRDTSGPRRRRRAPTSCKWSPCFWRRFLAGVHRVNAY
jgi:glucose-6-phosphate 1-dehydrogenase